MLTNDQILALVAPYMNCPEVVGLCLMGSYAAGDANELSDLDIGVFFEENEAPLPELDWPFAHDLWLIDRNRRESLIRDGGWQASGFLGAHMLYDRGGRAESFVQAIIAAKNRNDRTRLDTWDEYLNGLYRSLKYCRKGVEYGFRACAAESALAFFKALYFENNLVAPLPGRERASLWRVRDKLIEDDDEQIELVTEILRSGDPRAQAKLFALVEPYMNARGLKHVIDAWEGLLHLEVGRIDFAAPQPLRSFHPQV